MVYSNNLVATVKVGNKILRENQSAVAVPFGSEYSIYVKNLSSVRALVRVSIDGQPTSDVSDGWFIIGANDTLELERFLKNGNLNKGNRFKFIERTAQIEDHRGIGAEDGLVRVEYKFEIPTNYSITYTSYPSYIYTCGGHFQGVNTSPTTCYTTTSGLSGGINETCAPRDFTKKSPTIGAAQNVLRTVQAQGLNQMNCAVQTTNDAGITVAGSESNQQFSYGAWFPTEATSHVIVLKLVGKVGNKVVAEPVTVQMKPICSTCGRVNKATNKFCGRCGTALHLV